MACKGPHGGPTDAENWSNLRPSAPRTTKKSRSPGTLLLNARNGHFPFYPIYDVRPAAAGLSTTGLQIALHATRSPVTLVMTGSARRPGKPLYLSRSSLALPSKGILSEQFVFRVMMESVSPLMSVFLTRDMSE